VTFGKNLQDLRAFLKSDSRVAGSIPPNASSHKGNLGPISSLCSTPNLKSHSLIKASVEAEGLGVSDGEIGSSFIELDSFRRSGVDRPFEE